MQRHENDLVSSCLAEGNLFSQYLCNFSACCIV